MSVHPLPIPPVPDETARVARAAFPKGHIYLKMRDEFGSIYTDAPFVPLFPIRGQPGYAPWRLALVTIFQYIENLSDRHAADMVRGRIEWKYALSLELTDPGFDASVLSEFRSRLIDGQAEADLFTFMLNRFRGKGWVKAGGKQRTDSTHVLAAIRAMTRLELVMETLRAALNSLAVAAPDWVRHSALQEWVHHYARRADEFHCPTKEDEREVLAVRVGTDGYLLLSMIYGTTAPLWLREIAAVNILRQVWVQQFVREDDRIGWRANDAIPPAALCISSPYDVDAHYSKKRTMTWVGYKVHMTETCDPHVPQIVTHVETTSSCTTDGATTESIHADLKREGLLPRTHLVDTGYLDAELLAESAEKYGVDLYGPTRLDRHWQAQNKMGFAAADFQIDWTNQSAGCPTGKRSISWTPAIDDKTNAVVKIKFSIKDCRPCPSRAQCTTATRRTVTLRKQNQHEALQRARVREKTDEFSQIYAGRAGIEGTQSRTIRMCDVRHCRYRGQQKVHLQHLLTAAALNFMRVGEWLLETPRTQTRQSPFRVLMTSAA